MQPETLNDTLPPLSPRQYDPGASDHSLDLMIADFAEFGDTWRIWSPSLKADAWVVNDPEDVKRVLLTNHRAYRKGTGLDRVKILLGNGIMVSEGDFWRRQRRMMQPMFHRRVVEQFGRVIDTVNERFVERWAAHAASGEPLDLTEEMSQITLDIVLASIFGTDLQWLEQKMGGNPFALVTEMPERNLQFAYRFRSLTKLVGELLQKRRGESVEHLDFIAMLMDARDKDTDQPMADRELIDEVMTLVVAGHETTAASLTMVWWLLARHPEVERRLHAEVDAVQESASPSFQSLDELCWTQCAIKEALRLYPPGWLLSRVPLENDELSGRPVPAGTQIYLSPYLTHRHPAHWDAPEDYRPERFLPEAEAARHKFAYIPFAVGPRHCIGENFAMYEMTLHVARMARRFRLHWLPEDPIEFEAFVNLRTRQNLKFRVETR